MTTPLQNQTCRTTTRRAVILLALSLLAGALTPLLLRLTPSKPSVESSATTPVAISRTNLILVASRLCVAGQTNAFTGVMIEHQSDGALRSRSAVTNGLLHGLSAGWHTNGQLQVTEHFKEGASHGLRTKWYADGARLSEATIVDGQLHGSFRRWHENGALAEEMEMNNGQPDGIAKAYFPSGFMKSRTAVRNGSVVDQKLWKDGEYRESLATLTAP